MDECVAAIVLLATTAAAVTPIAMLIRGFLKDPVSHELIREVLVIAVHASSSGAYIRATANTLYHPVSTCKMGGDDRKGGRQSLKVRGLEGLCVIDASIMPGITSGNTHSPATMIARRALT